MRSALFAVVLISATTNAAPPDDKKDDAEKDRPSPSISASARAKALQDRWAKALGKSSLVEKNSIGMEMMLIPPGRFLMGSPPAEQGRDRHSEDQVAVTLTKEFYLGKTEVTQNQWQAVMGTRPWKGEEFVREGGNYAATCVSWDDAKAFCKKLSEKEKIEYRLPTEAEWEYACRGLTKNRFSFGDDDSQLEDFAWYTKNAENAGEMYAHEVGRKRSNPFGLHDMHGNVWEWCEDVYAEKCPGGTDPLVTSGAEFGDLFRVVRGGGWGHAAVYCRSAVRAWFSPWVGRHRLGFRVARSSGL